MTDKTFKVLVGCQEDGCAQECSYHLDMLRWWNDEPICEGCFDELPLNDRRPPGAAEDDEYIEWRELEPLTIKQARP